MGDTPVSQRGWDVRDGVIVFQQETSAADKRNAPSLELINHALVYAKELERIV